MRNSPRYSPSLALRSLARRVAGPVSAAAIVACGQSPAPVHVAASAPRVSLTPPLTDAQIRELDIEFYSQRARRDPTGAMDLARLGSVYLLRGRETGDPRDALLAERVARQSLRNRPNLGAAQVLESSLLSQHRFAEALRLAIAARNDDPENAGLRAAVGDIQMELGQYDSARASFANLHVPFGDLTVAPRLARWAEIQGQPDKARKLLHAALVTAQRETRMSREQLAWYWLRVGDVELRTGRPLAADSAYHAGLDVHPDDYRLLAALSHSAAVQQQWPRAIELGEREIAQVLDPATLGVLSDAYAALGDTVKSAEYARVLDVAVLKQPGAYHRAWSLFLLDHDRHVSLVARKIREELKTRKDVYAYDLLAWSLHKQGNDAEAAKAMRLAMREHTEDAQLFHHAAMIERALASAAATGEQP